MRVTSNPHNMASKFSTEHRIDGGCEVTIYRPIADVNGVPKNASMVFRAKRIEWSESVNTTDGPEGTPGMRVFYITRVEWYEGDTLVAETDKSHCALYDTAVKCVTTRDENIAKNFAVGRWIRGMNAFYTDAKQRLTAHEREAGWAEPPQ